MITTVDVGASKTLVAQFNSAGKMINNIRFATNKEQHQFYEELSAVLKKLEDVNVLSVGVPGIVDSLGVVKRCSNLPWTDFDLKGLLNNDFKCPVLIENDAKMAAIGETNALSPMPELSVYLTVSTGIGEGVVHKGRLVEALKYSEVGHIMVWEDNHWQRWEGVASGRAIKAHFNKMAKDIVDPEEWRWVCEKLTLGLSALIPTIQPDAIIFGGSVGHYFDRYSDILAEAIDKRLTHYIKRPQLLAAKHPEEAVIYGCYYYATHKQNS